MLDGDWSSDVCSSDLAGDFDVAGGETAVQVSTRVCAVLGELLASIGPGELAVAVSHGAAIRDAVPVLLGWPVADRAALHGMANCGWALLDQPAVDRPLRLIAYNRLVSASQAS
jgi:probable phosphoglycerate mutase